MMLRVYINSLQTREIPYLCTNAITLTMVIRSAHAPINEPVRTRENTEDRTNHKSIDEVHGRQIQIQW